MLTEADFEAAYGPLIHKWGPKLGENTMKELADDVTEAVQGLLQKTAEHQIAAGAQQQHVDVIHHGIDTFGAWKTKRGL